MSPIQFHLPSSAYKQLFADCPLGIALSRQSDSVFVEANAAFCELIGYSQAEVIGQSAHELMHWNNPQQREELLYKLKQHQDVSDFVVEIRKKSGDVITAQIAFSIMEIVGESYLLGYMTDLHDLEFVRQERRKIKEKLALATMAAGIGFWEWDPTNDQIFWTAEQEKIYGLLPGNFGGTYADFAHRIHPDDALYVEQCCAVAMANRSCFDFEFRIIRPDGSVRWIQSMGNNEFHENGRFLSSSGINIDITERKLAEQELKLSAEIMTNMAEGVALVSANNQKIVYANPKLKEILGYGPCELTGLHVSSINAPTDEDPIEVANRIINALIASGAWSGEVKNRRKDGSHIWCHATASTFEHPTYGKVWVNVLSDITEAREARYERDRLHNELQQLTAHMYQAVEAERRTLARDVHDQLGANLTAIRLRLNNLALRLHDCMEDSQRAELNAITELTSNTQLLTREICSRLRPSILDDLGLAEACRWLLGDWMDNTGLFAKGDFVTPITEPNPALSIDVFRTLQELLTNVARHADASLVQVKLFEHGADLCLQVSDDGRGFSVTDNVAGLGLVGIRERAHRHQGNVLIESGETGTMIAVNFKQSPK